MERQAPLAVARFGPMSSGRDDAVYQVAKGLPNTALPPQAGVVRQLGTRTAMIRTIDLLRRWMLHPPLSSPSVTTLIRLMVGAVFLWEAIMRFVFPETLGLRLFALIGLPAPELVSPFDAAFE